MSGTFPFVSDQSQSNSNCGFTPIWASALNIYPVTNANPFNPTTAQRDAAISTYFSASPGSITTGHPGSTVHDTAAPEDAYWVKSDGTTVQWMDNGVIVAPITPSLLLIGGTVGAPGLALSGYATTGLYPSAADTIGIAVSGALDFSISANEFDVLSGSTLDINSGGLLKISGAGTGTGTLVQISGPDSTHGLATYQYEATVSPSAVETALFTIPVMSRVTCVQANVQSALTGGGTTVTFGIGITGDVDAYGTASNSGVQADLLTKNAKINAMGTVAAGAGASINVWSAGTVAVKLIAAATGGATAGNTALTVGSVKIRVTYQTLLSIADAP